MQWLEAIGQREKWSQELIFSLTISLDEVLTNILAYAFAPVSAALDKPRLPILPRIALRCLSQPSLVQIEVTDNGRGFDPTQAPSPLLATSLDQAAIGGHGLRLVRHYLSSMAYERRAELNCLTLSARVDKTEA